MGIRNKIKQQENTKSEYSNGSKVKYCCLLTLHEQQDPYNDIYKLPMQDYSIIRQGFNFDIISALFLVQLVL